MHALALRWISQQAARCALAALAFIAVAATAAHAEPRTFVIDVERSTLEVRTATGGLLGGLAHDHVIRATRFTGAIVYDPLVPERSSVTITVETAHLVVADKGISDRDRRKITTAMREEVLHTARHPEIRFASRRVLPIAGGVRVEGDLTVHGTTREVAVSMRIEEQGATLGCRGELRFAQTDYGIEPYSTGLGTIQVKDEVTLVIDAVATEAPRAAAPPAEDR